MKTYILCEFQYGYTGQFYQVIVEGVVIDMVDLDGVSLVIPGGGEEGFIPYGASVINSEPVMPAWAENVI